MTPGPAKLPGYENGASMEANSMNLLYSYSLKRSYIPALCGLISVILLTGCVTSKPQHVVPISEAKNLEGSTKNVDGTFFYRLNFTPSESGDHMGVLAAAGTIRLIRPLNSINIELSFLNAAGEVTQKQTIFNSMKMKGDHASKYRKKQLSFEKEIPVPKGTDAVGFSLYSHDRPQRPGRGSP
jgi:hypothetical protein